ncbi:MAG: tetratricopeptide repeat protein [Cypionkella sp.]|nr:tetratricopeptide repeat protein [Cypionkella sp.]
MLRRAATLAGVIGLLIVLSGCTMDAPFATARKSAPSETEQVAQAAYSIGDYQESARLYELAAGRDPRSVEALLGLGRSYIGLGQYSRASNALTRAHDLSKNNADVLNELGTLALMQMHPKVAIEHFDRALRSDRKNLSAFTGKAVSLDYLSRHAEAQAVYSDALTYYPTNFALLNNFALSKVLSGDIGGGTALMEELLRDPSRGDTVRANMAIAYALDGRTRDARAMLEGTMSSGDIDVTLRHYANAREAYLLGKPIGYMIFN